MYPTFIFLHIILKLSLYTMDAEYAYTKKRMHFGKRCNFSDCDKTEVEIKSNPALMSNYVRIDPVTHATQCSKVYAVHEVQISLKRHL